MVYSDFIGRVFIVCECIEPSWVLIVLKELELINFMSHENTRIVFTKGINVIVGRRGSGKTAVLEAIRLAFGGLGRERLENLGKFVRYGASMAIIRLRMSNTVDIPGRPRIRLVDFLPENTDVVLERVIYRDGKSFFRINGKKVTKNDVIKMLVKVNISPRNTLFFLPQERVNEWVSLSTRERVDLLLSVLGLKELRDRLERVKNEILEKEKVRKELVKELRELEEEVTKRSKKVLHPLLPREKLTRYYAVKLAYLVSAKSRLETELEEFQRRIKEIEEKIVALHESLDKVRKRRDELNKEYEHVRSEIERITMGEKVGYEYELKKAEEKVKEYQAKLVEVREKYEKELQELEEIRKKWGSDDPEELRRMISERIERIKWIEAKLSESEIFRKIKGIREDIERLQVEKKVLIKELDGLRTQLRNLLRKLDHSGSLERVFNTIPRELLRSEIYGPVLLEIRPRVAGNIFRDYAVAIENVLGKRLLSAFIVTSPQAYYKMVEIVRKNRGGGRIDIITISRSDSGELISESALDIARRIVNEAKKKRKLLKKRAKEVLGGNEYLIAGWVCDAIIAPEPVLAVIESRNWDVPIVLDEKAAALILNRLGLSKAVTIDGSVVERRRDRVTGAVFYNVRIGGEESESILVDILGFSLEDFLKMEDEILSQVDSLDSEIRRLRQEIDFLRNRLPKEAISLEKEKFSLEEEIRQIEAIISRIQMIKKRLKQAPESIKSIQQAIESWSKRIDEMQDKIEKCNQKVLSLEERRSFLEEQIRKLIEEEADISAQIKALEREKEELPAKIRFLQRELKNIDEELSKTRREIVVIFDIMRRLDVIPRDKTTEDFIKKEIVEPANNLVEAMNINDLEKLALELEEGVKSYKEAIFKMESEAFEVEEFFQRIEEIKRRIKELDIEVQEIKKLYSRELLDLINSVRKMIMKANENYQELLSYIGARGEIMLEGDSPEELHFSITIDIHRDKPVEIDKGGFSSGEKTTAIMLMIIALFLTAPAPLYMFDEFDVFLDDKSLEEIMYVIKRSLKNFQGIITTTHREEILLTADNIVYMHYDEEKKKSIVVPISIKELVTKLK